MNLKGNTVEAGRGGDTVDHVLNGDNNETVEVLDGDPELMRDLDQVAQADGNKHGLHHFVISPGEHLSEEEWDRAIEMHKQEFGWGDRDHCVVRHGKKRSDGSDPPHVHILVAKSDENGKQLHLPHERRRNEKLARKMEVEFGHEMIKGKHNKAVMNALEKEGNTAVLDKMKAEGLDQGKPAIAKFSSKAHAKAKRLGVDLPAIGHDCAKAPGARGAGEALARAERDQGVTIRQGDRRDVVIMEKDDQVIVNVGKMFKGVYDSRTLLAALEHGRTKIRAEEKEDVAQNEKGAGRSRKATAEARSENRRGRGKSVRGSEAKSDRKSARNMDGAARRPGSRSDTTGRADGQRAGRSNSSSGQNGSGHQGAGQGHSGRNGSTNSGVSKAPGQGSGANPSALANLKTNVAIGRGFSKHGSKFASKSDISSSGSGYSSSSSMVGFGEFPDPDDPNYVEKVFAAFERSMRAANEERAAAERAAASAYKPPSAGPKPPGMR